MFSLFSLPFWGGLRASDALDLYIIPCKKERVQRLHMASPQPLWHPHRHSVQDSPKDSSFQRNRPGRSTAVGEQYMPCRKLTFGLPKRKVVSQSPIFSWAMLNFGCVDLWLQPRNAPCIYIPIPQKWQVMSSGRKLVLLFLSVHDCMWHSWISKDVWYILGQIQIYLNFAAILFTPNLPL